MNILIIGGTRFMGPVVVRQLTESGHQVTVFHRGESRTELPGGVREILGDRNHLEKHQKELRALAPDVVIDMFALNRSHAKGLETVFSGVARKAVVISSGDVYRNYDGLRQRDEFEPSDARLDELAPLRVHEYPYRDMAQSPDDWYHSYDKIHVEQTALSFAHLPATILRLPMVYGPSDRQHRLYAHIKRMHDRRPAILLGELEAACRFARSYSVNAAAAIVLAATSDGGEGQIYNVSEPTAFTERAWVEQLAEVMGWKGKIVAVPNVQLPEHLRSDLDWRYHLDMDSRRIRDELGFAELVPFHESLKTTIEWELANPPTSSDPNAFDYSAEDAVLQELI